MNEEVKEENLNPRQRKFIEFYLGEAHFNATKAAEMAGYKGNKNTLGVTAYDLLRNPKIKTELDACLSAMTMPANVVLTRLTEIAEGDAADVCDEQGNFSFRLAKERHKTHLLKKMKVKRTLKQKKTEIRDDMRTFLAEDETEQIESDVEIIYEEVEFELHDSHGALRDIGKHHKLFTDKSEIDLDVKGTLDVNIDAKIDEMWKDEEDVTDAAN
jgi:phage terminase small subunit